MEKTMDKIVQVAKARGFVYPGSEIYGGLANTWDYGNLGVELKNNVKRAWWKKFIQENPYNVGVDCAILMNPCLLYTSDVYKRQDVYLDAVFNPNITKYEEIFKQEGWHYELTGKDDELKICLLYTSRCV